MNRSQKPEVLFTDCLCFESFFSVGCFKAFKCDWYFASESKVFSPFRRLLERFFSTNFYSLNFLSYAEKYTGEISVYETIQQETKETLRSFLESNVNSEEILSFSKNIHLI